MECIVLGLLLHRKHAKATNSHVTITRLVVDVHISSAKRHAPLMQESMRRHPHKLDGMESLNIHIRIPRFRPVSLVCLVHEISCMMMGTYYNCRHYSCTSTKATTTSTTPSSCHKGRSRRKCHHHLHHAILLSQRKVLKEMPFHLFACSACETICGGWAHNRYPCSQEL